MLEVTLAIGNELEYSFDYEYNSEDDIA